MLNINIFLRFQHSLTTFKKNMQEIPCKKSDITCKWPIISGTQLQFVFRNQFMLCLKTKDSTFLFKAQNFPYFSEITTLKMPKYCGICRIGRRSAWDKFYSKCKCHFLCKMDISTCDYLIFQTVFADKMQLVGWIFRYCPISCELLSANWFLI